MTNRYRIHGLCNRSRDIEGDVPIRSSVDLISRAPEHLTKSIELPVTSKPLFHGSC
jgi:hypothetical protein